ncbi:putative 3-methyladenine DNA glycosylase [Cytophagales bacterium WSM2-2]|nr:putative 3-methyladenine DNA glycosylase [Cytophagales bacterium WSM2-2]
MKLPLEFYLRKNVTTIAKELLGKILVVKTNGQLTSGIIVETEAYSYKEKGSHAHRGMTKRNEVMFSEGGIAYVYLCYGVHEMFNVVTNKKGEADAILIRALEPLSGIELMMQRMRSDSPKRITSGPGKLAKALGIDRTHNGIELDSNELWIEDIGTRIKKSDIVSDTRIGIDYAGKDALLPWRFTVKNNPWVSK